MVGVGTGDTWGISGPTFLLLYGLLALLIGGAWLVALARATAGAPRPKQPIGDLTRRPEDLGYLNGGAELAVYTVLGAMRLSGTVALSRGTVRAAAPLERGAGELERAVHRVAARPTHRVALPAQRPVQSALDGIEQRLVRAGLLVPADTRQGLRRYGLLMLGVAGLGVVRLLAGLANLKPVGLLVLAIPLVGVAAAVMLVATPRRTRLGARALAGLRSGRHDLDPRGRPDWTLYGPSAAALGIGLFGVSALWASDPAMATELAAQRIAAGESGGGRGDGGGGGDGGGSGCGGAGGGCGGGGGGCGGGGCGG